MYHFKDIFYLSTDHIFVFENKKYFKYLNFSISIFTTLFPTQIHHYLCLWDSSYMFCVADISIELFLYLSVFKRK